MKSVDEILNEVFEINTQSKNEATQTESKLMINMRAAVDTILDIGSVEQGNGLMWIDYLTDAMKFRIFMHKFNNTNFAKHLGLVLSHDYHEVKLCGHRVCELKYFLSSHYSFFKLGGLDMFETFSEIKTTDDSTNYLKKARLIVNREYFVFTIYDYNGELTKETIDNHDLKIKFSVFPHDLKDEWLNYNDIENTEQEPTAREDYQVSLLDYLSYLNYRFIKSDKRS